MCADALVDVVTWLDVELGQVGLVSDLQTRIILGELVLTKSGWSILSSLLTIAINIVKIDLLLKLFLLLLHHELLCLFLGSNDFVKDFWSLLSALLVAEHLSLIDTEEQLDVKAINILQKVLRHRVTSLTQG